MKGVKGIQAILFCCMVCFFLPSCATIVDSSPTNLGAMVHDIYILDTRVEAMGTSAYVVCFACHSSGEDLSYLEGVLLRYYPLMKVTRQDSFVFGLVNDRALVDLFWTLSNKWTRIRRLSGNQLAFMGLTPDVHVINEAGIVLSSHLDQTGLVIVLQKGIPFGSLYTREVKGSMQPPKAMLTNLVVYLSSVNDAP